MFRCSHTRWFLVVFAVGIFRHSAVALDSAQIAQYVEDLKAGPALYYTPGAVEAFEAMGAAANLSGLSVNRDAAVRSFRAAARLGSLSLDRGRAGIPTLIDVFPRIIHVVEIPQATYAGRGDFEDCVSTYVMSAKNQFLISNPVLDYDAMSQCENFIEAPYQTEIITKKTKRGGAIAEATFNIKITFTFYAGECALSRLTDKSLGHDQSAWREWWSSLTNQQAISAPVLPSNVGADIVLGGKYRVMLNTGDDLTGTVESKTDTTMVLETVDGRPYSFRYTLMSSYVALELPKPVAPPPPVETPAPAPAAVPAVPPQSARPLDTVWIRNSETDNYGRAKPDIRYVGTVVKESDKEIEMNASPGNVSVKFSRSVISRIIRNSAAPADDALARYARPLICPAEMFLVDMPIGRAGKPFFKVCIDKYEFPNRGGVAPTAGLSFTDAKGLCEQQGKRLCTAEEWTWGCGGVEGFSYPYGNTLDQGRCNSDPKLIEPSGSRSNCRSAFGGNDMVGNIFEWVIAADKSPSLMGGPLSKCQTVSPRASGDAQSQFGVRCCKGN
jgi:hypothetical protein